MGYPLGILAVNFYFLDKLLRPWHLRFKSSIPRSFK